MKTEQIIEEIGHLSLPEKLLLVEDIWDSIALGNAKLPMPQWQKEALDKRYKEYQGAGQSLHDWETVHEALRSDHAE